MGNANNVVFRATRGAASLKVSRPQARMIILYDHPLSGNCHKVRMLLSMLGLHYESRLADVLAHVHHEQWFIDLNPLQQIPVLVDDDHVVQDSQAILAYLARRYGPHWISDDAKELGRIVEWLSFAANEINNSHQKARLHYLIGEECDIATVDRNGRRVLRLLDERLAGRAWLAAERPTIADLACFPYVALCREGRLPLDAHPHVLAWIDRIVALPGYVSMKGLPPAPAGASA
jgi:glutathione S-transferase